MRENQGQAMKYTVPLYSTCFCPACLQNLFFFFFLRCINLTVAQRPWSEHHGGVQCCSVVCGHKSCHFLTVHFLSLAGPYTLSLWLILLLHYNTAASYVYAEATA